MKQLGIQHLTIVTCDRCKTEARYDAADGHRWDWTSRYAVAWPAEVTPYTGDYSEQHALAGALVCSDCLTDAEREQLPVTAHSLESLGAF